MSISAPVGSLALEYKGWWVTHKWLLLRRTSQLSVLGVFLLGPWAGIWLVKGNLNASMTLETLPLTDPYLLLQSLVAGHPVATTALIGALIVAAFYLLVGGRAYCAWVCPVNIVTDSAHWLRTRLGLTGTMRLDRSTRYWLLAATLAVSVVTGTVAWEWINPVSMLHRGLIFGFGSAWVVVLAVFLFDLVMARRGWCGHFCPVGAFYSLIGTFSFVRVSAVNRVRCNDCTDCFAVCPEQHIIKPALKSVEGHGPMIDSANCTNCGRCIDICSEDVFRFTSRFDKPDLTVRQQQVI